MGGILYIDEIAFKKGRGNYETVVSDDQRLLASVEGRTSQGLEILLKSLPGVEQVTDVNIDMCRPFLSALKKVLPQARIHIDRFHLIKHLNDTVDTEWQEQYRELSKEARKPYQYLRWLLFKDRHHLSRDDRRALDSFLRTSPELHQTYWLAQQFRQVVLGCLTQEEAVGQLTLWMEKSKPHFRGFNKMLKNWFPYIVNTCTSPLSNARQEGINNTLKLVKRQGYGYLSRHTFRLRIFARCSP